MATPTQGDVSNGHLSPEIDPETHAEDGQSRNNTERVDAAQALPTRNFSPSPSETEDLPNGLANGQSVAGSSPSSPNDASEDADFDMDESQASQHDEDMVDEHASSGSSTTATKRKTAVAEDDYMRMDPELYGLRRSTRPRESRKVVDSDDSDSDVGPANRRQAKRRRIESSRNSSKRVSPARQSSSNNSDSDVSDVYGGARARTFQKKARLHRAEQPNLSEKRWSSRRAAQQVQTGAYEESDFDEEDDEVEQANVEYVADYVDDSPYVDRVVKHRVKDGIELAYDLQRHDFEYYIKWQGKSHLHDTWETTDSLKFVRGVRRVENYFRKTVDIELEMRFGYDIPPETKEQFFLDRERDEEAFEDYTKVERVVGIRDGEDDTEYYIKWKGLSYDMCTWEEASLISPMFQDKIDQYLDRASRSWQSDKKETSLQTRSRMTKLEEQPSYIQGGELRSFQLKGLNFLCLNWTRGNNVILADEMGLGKTVQTVSFLSWLRNDRRQEGPSLVVAPLSVIPAWCDTFNHWSPDINYVVYLGPEDARKIIRENELLVDGNSKKPKFNVLVTSYEFILQDWQFLSSIKWQTLAVDEAHRLKNRESQLYSRLVGFGVPCKILITGTPIQNNLAELSALLDFLNPGKVDIDEDLDSLSAADAQEKLQDLHSAIAPYIIRRTKETVESDLPPKTEKIIRVELSDVQLDYYKNIITRNYAALSTANNGHKNSLLNIMMELKKVSNHPYMFAGAEERVLAGSTRREDQIKGLIASSGKMMLLDQLLSKLKKDGHRVLIFSQMVRMLDILGDYMSLRGYKFQRLDGTIAAGPRRMAINHFNADDSEDFCFLLSTRAGGLGINLMTADTVVIFDSDWNPQADLQAMARAHRIGQKRPVNIYRLVSKETVEEEVLERARNKLLLEYLTIQAGVTDDGKAMMQSELNKKGLKTDGPTSNEDIQMVLKMRSSKMFEQSGNQERLEQLDIDSILENAEVTKTKVDDKINLSSGGIDWDNFMQITDVKVDDINLDWDQIIPADKLAEIKADEEKKQNEEYLAKLAAESAPRRATIKHRNKETDRADRLKKRQQEQEAEEAEKRLQKADPKRPLDVSEQRVLIKAYFKFGSIEHRADDIISDAKLGDRDPDLVKAMLGDFVSRAREAVEDNNSKMAEEEMKAGRALNKKDRKAVLIDFGELKKVNAETAIDRPIQLQLLREAVAAAPDWKSFRLPDATKGASYSCPWGAKEDGMLLVGIDRHGFGSWVRIRDDPDLGLQDKLFLEEGRIARKEERSKAKDKQKAPGAVHLVRRAEYLLSVLQAKHSSDKNLLSKVENHHRNNKKGHLGNGQRHGSSGSPAPNSGSIRKREPELHRARSHQDENGTPRPESKRKHANLEGGRSPKHRRLDEQRRSSKHDDRDRLEKRRHREEDDHRRDDRRDDRRADRDRGRHRDDDHHRREERSRDDRHREDRYRQDRHRDDRQRAERHRDDRRREDRLHDDRHRPDRHHDDRYRDERRRDDRRREDRDREDRSRDDRYESHRRRESGGHAQPERARSNTSNGVLAHLDKLRVIGDDANARNENNDALIWYFLKPVRENFERILSTTKETVKSGKERAAIYGDELERIGDFLKDSNASSDASLQKRFWDFLAKRWPVETAKQISGERLSKMYESLCARKRGGGGGGGGEATTSAAAA